MEAKLIRKDFSRLPKRRHPDQHTAHRNSDAPHRQYIAVCIYVWPMWYYVWLLVGSGDPAHSQCGDRHSCITRCSKTVLSLHTTCRITPSDTFSLMGCVLVGRLNCLRHSSFRHFWSCKLLLAFFSWGMSQNKVTDWWMLVGQFAFPILILSRDF